MKTRRSPARRPLLSASLGLTATAVLAAALAACSKPAEAPSSTANSTAPAASSAPVVAPATMATAGPPVTTTPAAPADAGHAEGGIAWRAASSDADVDAAFAMAKAEAKPVFVYWGAKWCPPCNQVKATLFNRQDFIERSRAFVPVYVDGDSPGAQKLGARFHVSGYPTMVLFSAKGEEVTRLPGEVEPVRYTQVLTLGMNAARPVKAVLADALAGKTLTANDWRLLAFYSWDTDEQQIIPKSRLPETLARLAKACPADQPETAMRLRLKALVAADDKVAAHVDATSRAAVLALLADPARTREETDMVADYPAEIVRALSAKGSPERSRLLSAFDAALKRLEADATLSRADRMQALIAQVDLVRIDMPDNDSGKPGAKPALLPTLPAPLLADIREQTAKADREITNGYERQAVITAAAYLLEHAGLVDESDTLLKANLARSHSPYYLMSELAGNAKKRGDKAEALHWYREAFEKSEGPATRLQWGSSYVNALIELSPGDEATIEQTTTQLWTEAARQPDAFYERSGRSLRRIGGKLYTWNQGGAHAAVMSRLQTQLGSLCAGPSRTAEERTTCSGLLAAPVKKAA